MYGLIPAPTDPNQVDVWRKQLHDWRDASRALLEFDDSLYSAPEFAWIPRTFNLCFLMMCDLTFYDGGYRLEEFVQQGIEQFGGYDAVILWHAYPRIGFDDRNQFDFYRHMPGGLTRLRELVDKFHAHNIRVYIDYNPWDTGTRREDKSDIDLLVDFVQIVDVDAIFLDTMSNAVDGLREKLDQVRKGVTLESEVLVPLEHLHSHPSSWAQSLVDVPGVLRNKWFERRHMQHRIKRWQHDHSPELHTAWMNGTGIVIWENVFGTYIGWNERDKSILRSMVRIQRRYHYLFSGEGWIPLIVTLCPDLYASQWEDENTRIWTLSNASDKEIDGQLFSLVPRADEVFYDLIHGQQIYPELDDASNQVIINGHVNLRGIGAILGTTIIRQDFDDFLSDQAKHYQTANYNPEPPKIVQILTPRPQTQSFAKSEIPADMNYVPADSLDMPTTFHIRECGFYDVPTVEFPELRYRYLHRLFTLTRHVEIASYAIDQIPVTNRQFAEFLQATGYQPDCQDRFLAHWIDGHIPKGLDDHPVVYVGLDDARQYAKWAGKHLPTEEEWQYAAGGHSQHQYPWGNTWQDDLCNHGQFGETSPVKQFPDGRSEFGCYDMCGNVWEWTESERQDSRTRFVILKGGSYYQAHGSEWYAQGGSQPNPVAAKFLLMYPGLDRCATIGFRCAVDVSD